MPPASPRSLIDLDHPMLKVHDLAEARRTFRQLGFTVTPLRSNDPMGGGRTGGKGGNHMVMLTPQTPGTTNMLELAYADPTHAWPALKTLLGGPEGLALMVHSPRDAGELRQEWEAAGIACDPVFEVHTHYQDPETGQEDLIHFRVAQPSGRDWIIPFGAAEIQDFRHYLREDWRQHANGAIYWSDITLIVSADDLETGREHLTKVYGQSPSTQPDGSLLMQIHKLKLRVLSQSQAKAEFAEISLASRDAPICHTALTIRVSDINTTEAVLRANSVPYVQRPDGTLLVAPFHACGTALTFAPHAS